MTVVTEIDKIDGIGLQPQLSQLSEIKESNKPLIPANKTEIFEDSFQEYISKSAFSKSGFIANEGWETNLNIQGKVSEINKEYVECFCLIDKENHYFEYRSFPLNLFAHMGDLKNKPYIILNIKSKAGSIRIDISDGDKRVEKHLFELEEKWNQFDGSDLHDTLDTPINI